MPVHKWNHDTFNNPNGTIQIKDGRIIVTNPTNIDGEYAMLNIPEHQYVAVYINGTKSKGLCVVKETDEILISVTPSYRGDVKYEFSESKDNMVLRMKKRVNCGRSFQVTDQPISQSIDMEVKNIDYHQKNSVEELQFLISQNGYVGTFNVMNLQQLGLSNENIELEVLYGKPPSGNAPGEYVILSTLHPFNIVKKGDILAEWKEGDKGEDGMTITGESVPSPPYKSPYEFKQGVEEQPLSSVAATLNGQFIFSNNTFQVKPIITISDIVNHMNSPLIVTEEALHLTGPVSDGAIIITNKDTVIDGGMQKTTILTDGNLSILKNTSSSIIYVGWSYYVAEAIDLTLRQFRKELEKTDEELPKINESQNQLIHYGELYGDDWLKESLKNLRNIEFDLHRVSSTEMKNNLLKDIEKLRLFIISHEFKPCNVSFRGIDNSQIYCYGNVEVNGMGCYLTNIHSTDTIKVTGTIKGGRIKAYKQITAGKFESVTDKSFLYVENENGSIHLAERNPLSTLKIMDIKNTNIEKELDVYFKYKKNPRTRT